MTSPQSLEILQRDHSIGDGGVGVATWDAVNGLPRLTVRTEQCEATLFAHGAHIATWTPLNPAVPVAPRPGLHLSPKSAFDSKKAIRGGIPLCWPWFGPRTDDPKPEGKASPAHGFARTTSFHVDKVDLDDENGRVQVQMSLAPNDATRALWDESFECTVVFSIGQTLSVSLEVKNTGTREFEYEAALHTYLHVGDVEKVQVLGLEGTKYFDKVAGADKQTSRDALVLSGETDSVFKGTKSAVTVVDPVLHRHLKIEKTGSQSTVVWNPWLVKAQAMPDVGGEDWRHFICVEAANVRPHHVQLPAGAVHATTTRITVIPQR